MRRAVDIVVALLAGIVVSPLMLALALGVAAAMGRPILFIQPRAGRAGQSFPLVKFRSMAATNGAVLADESRITPFGRVLRRTRLDELPELWNILRGDMSLIGPRPLLPASVAAMGEAGRARCAVRPGLTGWAQVNGNSLLPETDKVALDLWYIANRSVRLDVQVMYRTLAVMLVGERVRSSELERAYADGHRRGR
jgi:lipopolysaccharide/colanic/teichoic acid biosynthesis glycosyltransferase